MGKKPTVFQALDKAIRGDWGNDTTITPHVNSYDMSKLGRDVIYKTTNKDDYEQKKLELQQNKFLKDRWVKANVNMSVTAYAGLNNVKLMYRDADLMDAYPEIGAALDIVAEESTIPFPDNGQVVHVASKSERVKMVLEDLFVNRLNLQLTSPMVIRAMAKYGNQFMLLNIDRKDGVLGWRQMPVFNVERIENGIQNPYSTGVSLAVNSNDLDKTDLSTQFIWLDDNNSQVPFREWQVAHFRLLTNSLYLPYGVSYLNAARRHWRQLSLMEDMLLIYRLERSMERRVYKIFVGAIDDADIPAYIESVANEFKRTPIVDPMTGQIDLRKNILPVHKDTPIPLLDGRTITIEQLAREYEEGNENYVYSVQKDTLQIVGGKVVWCGKNYTADRLVKITLDDDTYTVMAPEHEVIMRDGSKKRADLLQEGESVMPLYRQVNPQAKQQMGRYEKVYNPNSGKYEYTHRLIAKEISKDKESYNTIHHKDFNKYNNNPTNLLWCDFNEHHHMHSLNSRRMWSDEAKRAQIVSHMRDFYDTEKGNLQRQRSSRQMIEYNKSEKHRLETSERCKQLGYVKQFEEYNLSELHKIHNEIRRKSAIKSWADEEIRQSRLSKTQINFTDEIWVRIWGLIISNNGITKKQIIEWVNQNMIEELIQANPYTIRLQRDKFIANKTFEHNLRRQGFENFKEYKNFVLEEHKVKKIEWVDNEEYKLVKITLDDDTYAIMAHEHEVIMRDGSKKRADMLQENESVMPLYRRDKLISSKSHLDYEQIYNPNSGKYEFTHRLIGKELLNESKREVIHHKDFNRYNNSPLNLQWMGWKEHKDYHISLNSSSRIRELRRLHGLKVGYRKDFEEYNNSKLHDEHNAMRCITSKESWNNEGRESRIKQLSINVDDYVWDAVKKGIMDGRIYNRATLLDFANNNLIDHIIEINKDNKRLLNKRKISRKIFENALASIGYNTITEYLDAVAKKEGCTLPSDIVRLRKRKIAYEHGFNKHFFGSTNKKTTNENGDAKIVIDDVVWDDVRCRILNKTITTRNQLLEYINTNWIDYLIEHNTNTKFIKNKSISETGLYWQVKHKYGMSVGEYIQSIKKNHKIKKIEWVSGDDVYCMTVVGPNGEDDRHNFAVCSINQDGSWSKNGIFVSNCYDQDVFIPVRDESAPTPIDTLSAGQNLTAIDDIKFVQNKVLTALRIPKTFLNFEENAGDGKNLALMDIRFTRVINRIQQAFLMELTRVAAIHLYLLGFNDDLTNFTLSMNNPSTQAEQLEIENMQKKIDAVRDAVSDPGNGMPVMSLTRALKEIMKWSEKDIKENFEQIRLEKGIAAELEKTAQIIKRTGIFDTVDRIYGEPGAEYAEDQQGQGGMGDEGGGGPMGGGGSMGAPMDDGGGELDNLGAPGADDSGDISGQEGMTDTQDMPSDNEQPMEGKKSLKQVLTEENKVLDNMFESYLRKVHEQKMDKNNPTIERVKSYDEDSLLISEEFDKMIDALGKFVKEDEKK